MDNDRNIKTMGPEGNPLRRFRVPLEIVYANRFIGIVIFAFGLDRESEDPYDGLCVFYYILFDHHLDPRELQLL